MFAVSFCSDCPWWCKRAGIPSSPTRAELPPPSAAEKMQYIVGAKTSPFLTQGRVGRGRRTVIPRFWLSLLMLATVIASAVRKRPLEEGGRAMAT